MTARGGRDERSVDVDDRPGRLDASALRVAGNPRRAGPRLRLVLCAAEVGPRPVRARVRRRSPPWPILPVATGTCLAEFSADRNRLAFAGGAVAETDPAVVAARGSSAVRPSSGARRVNMRLRPRRSPPCDTLRRRRRPRGFPGSSRSGCLAWRSARFAWRAAGGTRAASSARMRSKPTRPGCAPSNVCRCAFGCARPCGCSSRRASRCRS